MTNFYRINLFKSIIFYIVLAISACGVKSDELDDKKQNQAEVLKEIETIKAILVDMWNAIEQEDISRYSTFIHPDFTQFGETDPTLNIGKQMEIQGVEEWMKNAKDIHTEMEEPRVTVRGEVAWITYYWKDHGMTGGESFSSKGKSTRIFVKENGKWLCIHGHYTLL